MPRSGRLRHAPIVLYCPILQTQIVHLFASLERRIKGAGCGLRALAPGLGLLVLLGCPQDVRPLGQDSGTVPIDGGARPDAGRVVDGGFDAGMPADVGGTGDAGDIIDGGQPVGFRWSQMVLPAGTRTIVALWGRSRDDVFAGTSNGSLLHYDGNSWTEFWDLPNNDGVRAIHGTPDRLFVAGSRRLWVFSGALSDLPAEHMAGNEIKAMHAVNNNSVYILSLRTSSRGLYHYDGSVVTEVIPNLEAGSLNTIWTEPGPKVWVGANGKIFYYDGAAISEDPIEWPPAWNTSQIANFYIRGMTGHQGHRLAVGSGGGILSDETGNWRFERPSAGGDDLRSVTTLPGGTDPTAIAVGDPVDDRNIYLRTPRGWEADPYTSGRLSLWTVWAGDKNQVFAGGSRLSTFEGVLLRGTK